MAISRHLFSFVRSLRTTASESYIVWPCQEEIERGELGERKDRIGYFDLHYESPTAVHGTLIIEKDLPEGEIDALVQDIFSRFIGDEDVYFYFQVFRGNEIACYG